MFSFIFQWSCSILVLIGCSNNFVLQQQLIFLLPAKSASKKNTSLLEELSLSTRRFGVKLILVLALRVPYYRLLLIANFPQIIRQVSEAICRLWLHLDKQLTLAERKEKVKKPMRRMKMNKNTVNLITDDDQISLNHLKT